MKIDANWLVRDETRRVTGMLEGAGHQALFVGGCVRNALLGAPVNDLDISTDARPDRVMDLAQKAGLKAIPTGIDHGTVTVMSGDEPFEITTFRKDVETDGRHAVVAFADTVEEDARRRDFTMNALYCDGRGNVIDPLNGLPDLRARHLRFIDDPVDRIREDYLRILRFFRFHAWYGRDGIDADGLAACAELSDGLAGIAKERIGQEMLKLLAAPDPGPSMASMEIAGVLMRCLPGASASSLPILIHHESASEIDPNPLRRLALIGGEDPAHALRMSRKSARDLRVLRDGMQNTMPPAELGYRLGAEAAIDVMLNRAAMMGAALDQGDLDIARHGARQTCPIQASDITDRFHGPTLGEALKRAEAAYIASGFTLSKKQLLDLDYH